jgi:hypothetical protein
MKTQHKLELTEAFGEQYYSNICMVMKEVRSITPDYISFSQATLDLLVVMIDNIGQFIVDLTHKSFCQTPYRIDNSLEFGIIESMNEKR